VVEIRDLTIYGNGGNRPTGTRQYL